MSYQSEKIKKELEKRGQTNVRVWWEPIMKANVFEGPGGGWLAEMDPYGVEPLGLNFEQAIDHAQNASWLQNGVI